MDAAVPARDDDHDVRDVLSTQQQTSSADLDREGEPAARTAHEEGQEVREPAACGGFAVVVVVGVSDPARGRELVRGYVVTARRCRISGRVRGV